MRGILRKWGILRKGFRPTCRAHGLGLFDFFEDLDTVEGITLKLVDGDLARRVLFVERETSPTRLLQNMR